jgi:hypothetical protein
MTGQRGPPRAPQQDRSPGKMDGLGSSAGGTMRRGIWTYVAPGRWAYGPWRLERQEPRFGLSTYDLPPEWRLHRPDGGNIPLSFWFNYAVRRATQQVEATLSRRAWIYVFLSKSGYGYVGSASQRRESANQAVDARYWWHRRNAYWFPETTGWRFYPVPWYFQREIEHYLYLWLNPAWNHRDPCRYSDVWAEARQWVIEDENCLPMLVGAKAARTLTRDLRRAG